MIVNRILLFIIICLTSINLQAYTIKLSIGEVSDKTIKIEKGNEFQISYLLSSDKYEDLNSFQTIEAPKKVDGCEIISFNKVGNSKHTSFINGVKTETYSARYILSLKSVKKGKYSFGPIKIGDVKSNKLDYEIISNDNQLKNNHSINDKIIQLGTGNEDLFLKVEFSDNKIYKNIPFYYIIKLYTKYDRIRDFDFNCMPKFNNCNYNDTYDVSSRFKIEEFNGQKYATCIAERFEIIPLKKGRQKINKGKYEILIDLPVYYADPFWGRVASYKTQRYILDIPEISYIVETLDSDIPEDFDGLIGEFNISSKLSNDSPKVNETILLSYIIAGEVKNVENKIEQIILNLSSENFEIRVNKNIENLPEGFRKCEYFIIPRVEGVFTIPTITLTYLNPETNTFESIDTKEYNIVVGGHKN